MYDHYLPIILAALAILIVGCWNPRGLQSVHAGQPSGHPSYLWLSLISLIVGLVSCYALQAGKGGYRMEL